MSRNKIPKQRIGKTADEATPDIFIRAVGLPADFGAVHLAISGELHEWAAVDGNSASQEAMVRFLERQWKNALDALGIEDEGTRDEAHSELVSCHILYRCLTRTLDQAPKFETVRSNLLAIKRDLEATVESLDKIENALATEDAGGKYDAAYARELTDPLGVRSAPLILGDVILSRQFELYARQFVETSLRRLERLLSPLANIGNTKRRGQPRKYSKTFLILRCARIFEMFDSARRIAMVNQTNEARRARRGRLAPAYESGFVPFIQTVLKAIEPDAAVDAPFALGRTVRSALSIRGSYPSADQLISGGSTSEALLAFMEICEGKPIKNRSCHP